jgi:Ser/Thr protein kinase RdoA (MazF antagonist)
MLNALQTGRLIRVEQRKAADIYPFLEAYIAKKEHQIAEILQVVDRYEKKRMMEERSYQAMSPLRRMFSGKKPDHHVAVEYIHYVKKPMEQVKQLRSELEAAQAIVNHSKPQDLVNLSEDMEKEMMED